MDSYQATLTLNNNGIRCLAFGDLQSALTLFRQALVATARDVQTPFAPPNQGGASARTDDLRSRIHASFVEDMPAVEYELSKMYKHSNGISLVSDPTTYSSDDLVQAVVVSSVIMYNLALTYHLSALESGYLIQSRDCWLDKARSLYQRAHILLNDAGISTSRSSANAVVDLIAMSILNNLGHVFFQVSEYRSADACFEDLARLANTVHPALQYQDEEVVAVLELHKTMYLLNVVTYRSPKHAPAA